MTKRLWVIAAVAGILAALPVALVVVNLAGGHASHTMDDLTWGMIFSGMAMMAVGALLQAPLALPALAVARRQNL